MRSSARWSLLLAASLLFAAPVAHAQSAADRATARELGQDGQTALDKKDFKTAEDRFRRADALFHAPTLLLGYARAEAGLGKVVNASEAYSRIIREGVAPGAPPVFVNAVESAKAEVGPVQARVAGVTITITGPENPTVLLDDQPVPVAALGVKRPVDPGEHVVKASADGWEPTETKFTVADAGAANAALTLKKSAVAAPIAGVAPITQPTAAGGPPPAATDASPASDASAGSSNGKTQRTIGIVGIAVGGAALAAGAVTGFLALGKHSDLANSCQNGTCPASVQSDVDSFHSLGTISTISFIAGGVLAGGGLILFLTAPHGQSAPPTIGAGPHVTPFVGLGSVGAVGTF